MKEMIEPIKSLMEGVLTSVVFEENDAYTYNDVRSKISDGLDALGVKNYLVLCDEDNNKTPNMIELDVYFKDEEASEFAHINGIAGRTGLTFEAVLGALP